LEQELKENILSVINGTTTLKEVGEIDHRLALEFAKAVNLLLKQEGLKPKDIETDIVCEKCGEPMVIKTTKKGQFLACTGFPKCRNAKSFKFDKDGKVEIVVEVVVYGKDPCPKCGKKMIFKSGMYGDYYACEDYPKICKTTRPVTLDIDCPTCGEGKIAKRKGKKGRDFYSCSRYPDCKFISSYKPINESCPECDSNYLIEKYSYKTKKTTVECPKKECKYKKE
jgi:DNA topoisomerase-1